ncbi:MAG: CheR family methyltransferase [Acidobacteriaceae bacterium]
MSSITVTDVAASGRAAGVLSPQSYAFLQNFIRNESGIVIDENKEYLLETRLLPVLRRENLPSLESLCARLALRSSPGLARQVIEAMTTHETFFFRDTAVFDSLRQHILPAMLQRASASRTLRIWSAAASSGQEAYSLAMQLLELGALPSQVEIVGTDLSEKVLERAREGKYVQFEVSRGLPSPYLLKYFARTGLAWTVREEVRGMVRFQPIDLRKSFTSLGLFDLVLCRNVLIYFDLETKRQVLSGLRQALDPQGILALGSAETLLNLDCGLHPQVIGSCTFYAPHKEAACSPR